MYAKVFKSLWNGSLRGTGMTQLVFVYMLAHADSDGVVEVVPAKIADDIGCELGEVTRAIGVLEAEDEDSRSLDHGGKRVIRTSEHRHWGWLIVNYRTYRGIRDEDDRKKQNAEAQRRWRDRAKSASVSQSKPKSSQEEAEGEAEGEERIYPLGHPLDGRGDLTLPISQETTTITAKAGLRREWEAAFHQHFWPLYPRKIKKDPALKAWHKIPASEDVLGSIISGLEWWIEGEYSKRPKDKIDYPATWLNQKSWEDAFDGVTQEADDAPASGVR